MNLSHLDRHAHLALGKVWHRRLRPRENSFVYDTFTLLLPMRALRQGDANAGLATNRRGLVSFYDSDHGDGRSVDEGGALAWLDSLLVGAGIDDACGEVWLQTYPRMFGFSFKPVSFWFCHDANNVLIAVLVEVNNTFGERHCYLLDKAAFGKELHATKCFHVSPFCSTAGHYRFYFTQATLNGRLVTSAKIDYDDDAGPLIQTSLTGQVQACSQSALNKALLSYPAMTFMVLARIHWQALKLLLKRVRVYSKPPAPAQSLTR